MRTRILTAQSQELMAVKRSGGGGGADDDEDVEQSNGANGSSGAAVGLKAGGAADKKDAYTVFTQALTLTFLAEWGDRSQIATIAMAAAKDVVGVTLGGILGHTLCTGMAVVGGRLLAARISERTVHLVGGGLFLVFGLHSLVFGL
jgi:Ca2+/H+ antiporter, TMEM165/GDT1 family